MCNSSLTNDLHPDCDFPLINGVKERIIIILKENVLSVSVDVVNGLIVTDIILKPGTKANYILGIRNSNTSDTQMTEGEYQNSFIHNVSCLVFETDLETDEQIQNLSNTNNSYYIIVEKRDEQKSGKRQFKMYGYPVGMICNSIQQTVNDITNLGAWFLTFTNDTVANIPNVPVSIYTGDQASTIDLVNSLLNTTPIPDTTYDLINSNDNIIGSGDLTCETNNLIDVIDTPINLTDSLSGSIIKSFSAPSGELYNISIDSDWIRPYGWLKEPNITENENCIWALLAVFENNPNWLALGGITFQSGTGVVEVYNDVNLSPITTITTGFTNLSFSYSSALPSSLFRGYRQLYLKVRSSTNDLITGFNIGAAGTTTYGSRPTGLLEILFSNQNSNITGQTNFGSAAQMPSMLERVKFSNFRLTNMPSFLSNSSNMKKLEINPGNYNITGATMGFTSSMLRNFPKGVILSPTNSTTIFSNSNLENIILNMVNVTTSTANDFINTKAKTIHLMNMGSISTSFSMTGNTHTIQLIFDNYKASHNITPTSMFGNNAFMIYANSLGIAASSTITMTSLQYSSFGGSGSAVEILLLSKGWLINVV